MGIHDHDSQVFFFWTVPELVLALGWVFYHDLGQDTLSQYSAPLHLGEQMGTGKFIAMG